MTTAIDINYKDLTDGELVGLIIENQNKNVYSILMKRYQGLIYYKILRMIKNRAIAKDLTIEAFTKAFIHLDQYNPGYSFSTWLRSIANNHCIDFLRKQRFNTITDDAIHQIQSTWLTPVEILIKKQNSIILQNAISTLSARDRLLIELYYFKELKFREIAEQLNTPINSIKVYMHRMRKILYQRLIQYESLI